ncbi:hypothetical protein GQ44DRAFT_204995 [Phaeosphaeriaceae sp. PMI808]|nr:hypothetical protein GQ44DRAFT_204995 [Phaeosphaeriaceae sp. PMI808]
MNKQLRVAEETTQYSIGKPPRPVRDELGRASPCSLTKTSPNIDILSVKYTMHVIMASVDALHRATTSIRLHFCLRFAATYLGSGTTKLCEYLRQQTAQKRGTRCHHGCLTTALSAHRILAQPLSLPTSQLRRLFNLQHPALVYHLTLGFLFIVWLSNQPRIRAPQHLVQAQPLRLYTFSFQLSCILYALSRCFATHSIPFGLNRSLKHCHSFCGEGLL